MKEIKLTFPMAEFDGLKFLMFDTTEHIQVNWAHKHYYEPNMIKFIQQNYKGGTMIDAGACIGNHTLAFSKIADLVISFEPLQQIFLHLSMNLAVNVIKNVVTYNIALSNRNGVEEMTFVDGSAGGGEIRKGGEYIIPVLTLDAFKIKNINLIKIDVQEHEAQVLEGAKETIKEQTPDLFIECTTEEEKSQHLIYLQTLNKV